MKLKLAAYITALLIGFTSLVYAAPDYSRLKTTSTGPSAEKQTTAVTVKNPGAIKAPKNNSHHFKSRILNSTRPVQRCLKSLKI